MVGVNLSESHHFRERIDRFPGTFEDNGWSLLANMVFDGNFVELTRHEREMFIDYPSKLEA